ncbi:rod-binding protein [Gluconobacter japonicus]|uniref:rod-binding protein n=1 Tax=Gluconobacter japonicus TaxID=376620 RepID=UPI0039E8F810
MTVSSIPTSTRGYALHNTAPDTAKTMKAAQDFESMTINQMLQPMFQTDDDSQNMFSGGAGEKQFRPMMVEQIAKQMENNGGIGLTDAINRQMLAMQEQK